MSNTSKGRHPNNGQSSQDRRCHYRVEDQLYFSFTSVSAHMVRNQAAHQQFKPVPGFELLNELKSLDQEAQNLLRDIAQQHRSIAIYLSIINKKFDLMAQHLISSESRPEQDQQKVNLSEGGIGFNSESYIPAGEQLALHLRFPEQNEDVYLYGKVIRCLQSEAKLYHLAVQFIQTSAHEQKSITRRVLKVQMQSHKA